MNKLVQFIFLYVLSYLFMYIHITCKDNTILICIFFSDSSLFLKPSKKDEKGSSSIESVEGLSVSISSLYTKNCMSAW